MTIDYSKFDNIEDSDDEKVETAAATAKTAEAVEKPHCHNCHKDIAKPLRCGICKKVEYCSAKCQKEDWQFHKRVCKKIEEPKAKEPQEKKAPKRSTEEAQRREKEEEKVTENDEEFTWYRHREWKPTAEPKKDFTPTAISAEAVKEAASTKAAPAAGSAWNAAGTWEDKDVTSFAQAGLKAKLAGFSNVDAAGGVLSAEDVEAVEGEASKPVIRGRLRHMFDLSFKVKLSFKWMDASGQRSAAGQIEIEDFTNDTFMEGVLESPVVRLSFKDGRLLDAGRKQAVEAHLGTASWPPPTGSLMAGVAGKMEAWAQEYSQTS